MKKEKLFVLINSSVFFSVLFAYMCVCVRVFDLALARAGRVVPKEKPITLPTRPVYRRPRCRKRTNARARAAGNSRKKGFKTRQDKKEKVESKRTGENRQMLRCRQNGIKKNRVKKKGKKQKGSGQRQFIDEHLNLSRLLD